MQDIQSIAGGRTFVVVVGGGGSSGTGDRRLRPQLHPALKCPRCDSINTKFCYYNNYNLSQPRHFCKSCRRYWTKGGVLRNVPVGGGCRKTKRSKAKSSAPDDPPPLAAETATTTTIRARDRKTRSHSSSESSSLTGTTTAAAAEAVSATSSITPTSFFSNTDNKSIITQTMNAPPGNHGFDQQLLEQSSGCGLFSEMGNFASLLTSTTEPLPFECSSVLDQNSHWSQQQDLLEQQIQQPGEILSSDGNAFLCQTVPVDLSALQGRPSGNESFGQLDWQPAADHGMFDLAGAVDQAYWGQNSQWAYDEDYLP